ncbi:MAG: methylisocitrate lyase [Gammaproteobacteria bacterium]|nr:methylisocitrate lyase [Gammaproteobacteria bacterium]
MADEHMPGKRLYAALEKENPLAVVGTINAYSALLAQKAGFRAIYLSGAGVANASFGMPDLGVTTLDNVTEDVFRITSVTDLPIIVDADTGFDNPALTTKSLLEAGAAGLHIEDQVDAKRCGHRPGKILVSAAQMQDRIKAAVDARIDSSFAIIARTDAHAVEGLDAAIERANLYIDAGADMIFAEALTRIAEFHHFSTGVSVPVLANMTEFGKTPTYTMDDLGAAGVELVLYPLTAFRAMSAAALKVYKTLRMERSQATLLEQLQSRDELYEILNYHEFERNLDEQLTSTKNSS